MDYSPETPVSNISVSNLESSPQVTKKNDSVVHKELTPRDKEPAAPSVGLIIGNEPDPVCYVIFIAVMPDYSNTEKSNV